MKKNNDLNQKILLIVILYFTIFVFFNNLYLKKVNIKIKSKENELMYKTAEYSKKLVKTADYKKIKLEYDSLKEKYNNLREKFIENKEKKLIIDKITELAKKYSLNINSMEFGEKNQDFLVKMNLKGNYENVVNYFYELKLNDKNINFNRIILNKDNTLVSVNMEISSYVLSEVEKIEK